METFFYFYIFIIWLLFWSFASVIIYRLRSKEPGTFLWRSHCNSCNHKLWTLDLFPVFSWLFLKWKCRYCKAKIPPTYICLELVMWSMFVITSMLLTNVWLVLLWNPTEIFHLLFLLIISFFSIIFVFYDILYLEIPESILAIIIASIYIWLVASTWEIKLWIIWILSLVSYYGIMLWEWKTLVFDVIKDYSILLVNWLLLLTLYNNWLSDSALLHSLIAAYFSFVFFFLQYSLSWGKILWGWDLRIAIFLWLFLSLELFISWIVISYVTWSIIWITLIATKFLQKQKVSHVIPFWPFLFLGIFITAVYWNALTNWYINFLESLI